MSQPDNSLIKGKLIIMSSPSRGGKDVVIKALLQDSSLGLHRIINYTTRAIRTNEKPGVDYHFLTKEEFTKLKKAGKFLETANVTGQFYGTNKDDVWHLLETGKHALLKLEVKGARQVIKKLPGLTVSIFLKPEKISDLRKRFQNDPNFTPDQIKRRLAKARREIKAAATFYDHIVVSQDGQLAKTIEDVRNIVKKALSQANG